MDKETHIHAGLINRNHTTTLKGIIRIDSGFTFRDDNPVANGDYRITVHGNTYGCYEIIVTYDSKGTLKFSRSGLAKSKKAFEYICFTLFYDDIEVEKASDAYKQRAWQVIEKCVAEHVKSAEWASVFDIIKDANEEEVEISRVNAANEKRVSIDLNTGEFLYENGAIKFRVRCRIEDEARGVCFSVTYLAEATPNGSLSPASYSTGPFFNRIAYVSPIALRGIILNAMEYGVSGATSCGKVDEFDPEVIANLPDAKTGYKLILDYFHRHMMIEMIA